MKNSTQHSGMLSCTFSFLSSSVTSLCRFAVQEFLSRGITVGSLTFIHEDTSEHTVFGQTPFMAKSNNFPIATITIHDSMSFYTRVAATADIGFAEAFMAGDFSVKNYDELVYLFKILIANRDSSSLSASSLIISKIGERFNTLLHLLRCNSKKGSVRNIEAHYDLSNELFGTFLGSTWVYSCGFFKDEKMKLDEAQNMKLDMIINKARIENGNNILEIGCGWGEFGIRTAKRFENCTIHGITLSKEQLDLAKKRAKENDVDNRVSFELIDYREIGRNGKKYDRIISIEMIEAVGDEYLDEYFEKIDELLEKDGLVVIQAITTPNERYESYRTSVDFIQKHIFPGGICPSMKAIINGMTKKSSLEIEEMENIGIHYATTLKEWRKKFLENVKNEKIEEIGFDKIFIHKWIYYLCYCEAGFSSRTLGTIQMVLSRTNNIKTLGENIFLI